MIHWVLQFAIHIASRCVLHRYENQGIHCQYLFNTRCVSLKPIMKNLFQQRPPVQSTWRLGKIEQKHSYKIARPQECRRGNRWNDPSAGSPTETLLRLLLPLNVKVYTTSSWMSLELPQSTSRFHRVHRNIQSVGATGGVYKGQGRNQCKLMTCVY